MFQPFPPDYQLPCAERIGEEKKLCGKLCRATGFEIQTSPKMCGQCMISTAPNPNEDYLLHKTLQLYWDILEYVILGFYSEEQSLEIFERFYAAILSADSSKPFAQGMVENSKKRLTLCWMRAIKEALLKPIN